MTFSLETLAKKVEELTARIEKLETKRTRFEPPTVEQVFRYMLTKEMGRQEAWNQANMFVDYFAQIDWVVGTKKAKMKDWQAAVRNWLRNCNGTQAKHGEPQSRARTML